MANFRGAHLVAGAALAASSAFGTVVAGCGSSTSGTGAGEQDGSSDGTAEGMSAEDAKGEDVTADQSLTADVGSDSLVDVSPGFDGPDSGPGDAARDANDASDEGDAADGYDGYSVNPQYSAMLAFANAEGQAWCQSLLAACPVLDAGSYDLAACKAARAGYGWEGNVPSNYSVLARPYITFDSTKASNCLSALFALPEHTQTAATWQAVTQACELVLTGSIPVGQGTCTSSFECGQGSYCSTSGDAGGGGVCTALRSQGQTCTSGSVESAQTGAVPLNPLPDFMCSYLGSGDTGLFCNLIPNTDGGFPSTYGTCQPLLTTPGANCGNLPPDYYYDDQACGPASGGMICGDNGCGTDDHYPYVLFSCPIAAIVDAGGGG